ncbi:MAG: signal peptide peptidase SppA [Rhodospirillaceae bacterium]|nr:MAG: signal peptide peptidase SppA [Rhodospirillaceae bacterium]
MSLDADIRIDRQTLKRKLAFWRVLAILAVVVGLLVIGGGGLNSMRGPYIARVDVTGIIVDDRDRDAVLRAIAEDDRIKAVIVHIDSPGGTMVGGEAIYSALRDIAEQKPVVAVLGTVAASGGYMTALAADYILARAGTITGSIGVIFQTAEITSLLEKLGIKTTAIKSAPLKASPSPLEKLTPQVRHVTQAMVDDMFSVFVAMVADRRGMGLETARALADGRVYTGRQALARKLVDALGGEGAARKWLEAARGVAPGLAIRDVAIHPEPLPWRQAITEIVGKTVFSERLTLDGLVSLWHP